MTTGCIMILGLLLASVASGAPSAPDWLAACNVVWETPSGDSLDHILLLPAWPKGWDVDFRLHAPHNTTVEYAFCGGKLEKLEVTPESRRKDVVTP